MNVLSLFDGMSCGQIALNRLNLDYKNYFASEIDPHAIKVTQANYPDTKQIGSVTDVRGSDLPKIDLLIGGSPCQGFSSYGKLLNFNDPRSVLFFEFVRLLKETKPTFFMLENVNMKKEYRDIISEHLGVEPIRINAALMSAAKRDRLYWTNIPGVKQPEDKNVNLDDILDLKATDWLDESKIGMIKAWKAYKKPLEVSLKIGGRCKIQCLTARGFNQYHSGMVLVHDELMDKYRYLSVLEGERELMASLRDIPLWYLIKRQLQ